MPSVTKSITIKAPIERVFEVITDFENYPEFLPEMEYAEIKSKSKTGVKVFFTTNLIKKVSYTLLFKLKKPDSISWKMTDGDPVIKMNTGSWKLEAMDKKTTEATFSLEMDFNIWMPKFVADGLIKSNLPSMLTAFKKRSERK